MCLYPSPLKNDYIIANTTYENQHATAQRLEKSPTPTSSSKLQVNPTSLWSTPPQAFAPITSPNPTPTSSSATTTTAPTLITNTRTSYISNILTTKTSTTTGVNSTMPPMTSSTTLTTENVSRYHKDHIPHHLALAQHTPRRTHPLPLSNPNPRRDSLPLRSSRP